MLELRPRGTAGARPGMRHLLADDREWVYGRRRPAFVARLEGSSVNCREISWRNGDRSYRIGDVVVRSGVVNKRLVLHGGHGLTVSQLMFLFWVGVVARRQGVVLAGV